MSVKNWSVVALVGALTLSLVTTVRAEEGHTANLELRVWQSTRDAQTVFVRARLEGARWDALGPVPLDLSGLSSSGAYRYGDITGGVALPLELEPFTVNMEIRVWQGARNAGILYISARHEGGRWDTLGTTRVDMGGLNSRGTFRYGGITLPVPVPGPVSPSAPVEPPGTIRFSPELTEPDRERITGYVRYTEQILAYRFGAEVQPYTLYAAEDWRDAHDLLIDHGESPDSRANDLAAVVHPYPPTSFCSTAAVAASTLR
ncbi:MAG: hypothetical protein F4Z08_03100 [Chloroflexi bacterium]|nr:hypothetical protein [Chloroflexota bacterium]